MTLQKFFPLFLISSVILFVLMFGCSEEPKDVGAGLLAPQDTLHIASRELSATRDTTFQKRIIGNSGRLLVGKSNNLEATSLVQFSSIPAFPVGAIIDSAIVTLRVNYSFQDTTGLFGIDAHNMLKTWSATTFTWDSLANSYDNAIAGQDIRSFTPQDTMIQFHLDTALIRIWSVAGTGSLALTNSPGVIGMNLVLGFSNIIYVDTDTRPKLTISYHDIADTTISVEYRSSQAIFVANIYSTPFPHSVLIQAGVATLGVIKFDSLALPPKVSITQATLELTIDQSTSITNHFTRDSLIVYLSRKDALPYDSLILATVCSPVIVGAEKKYIGDVTNIVQRWIGNEPNLGIVVQPYGEFTTLDRFLVHGAGGPAALWPKLKITYTMFP
jgi:hypothetical protein